MAKKIRVVLKLDIYRHIRNERYWERQVWVGYMPHKDNPAEYDPLLLQKEYEFGGGENVLFRLDAHEREKGEAIYRPLVLHFENWFLQALPKWGFTMESSISRESIS